MHYCDSSDRIHLLWVRRTYELSKHKEVQSWQSAVFVEKALISETMWVILIEDLIECGNQTSRKLNVMLMVLQNHYTFVLLVWDPTKLKEHKKNIEMAGRYLPAIFISVGCILHLIQRVPQQQESAGNQYPNKIIWHKQHHDHADTNPKQDKSGQLFWCSVTHKKSPALSYDTAGDFMIQ